MLIWYPLDTAKQHSAIATETGIVLVRNSKTCIFWNEERKNVIVTQLACVFSQPTLWWVCFTPNTKGIEIYAYFTTYNPQHCHWISAKSPYKHLKFVSWKVIRIQNFLMYFCKFCLHLRKTNKFYFNTLDTGVVQNCDSTWNRVIWGSWMQSQLTVRINVRSALAGTVGTYLECTCFSSKLLYLRLQQYTDHITGQLNIVERHECCMGIRMQERLFHTTIPYAKQKSDVQCDFS